jgi:protein O-GlcNAc transferase
MLGAFTNFYLPYQGQKDLELQIKYGALAHRIMAANYPEWAVKRAMPTAAEGGKIRVGYVSAYFFHHSVGNMYLGNFRYADNRRFELYCYNIGDRSDYTSAQFRHYTDKYHHVINDLEGICKQIIADRLHVLVFPDIGMHPQITQMAALRLAPVQCNSWGNPVTCGIPTVDYYLSGDLMEPEGAQGHYSERLIRLPNIGIAYPKADAPVKRKGREAFGIRADSVAYLSCQSLYKYLPRYDHIFPEIAQRVPDAQFVFLSHPNIELTAKFGRRLKRSFARYNLDSEKFCVVVPRLKYLDYMNVHSVSDIYLDTLAWSGANTTLETVACGLPVVTLPGEFMRGRHSYAILKMLGVEDTIAENESEYIRLAVDLGLRPEWRKALARRIRNNLNQLYDDKSSVAALEEFYREAVSKGF